LEVVVKDLRKKKMREKERGGGTLKLCNLEKRERRKDPNALGNDSMGKKETVKTLL